MSRPYRINYANNFYEELPAGGFRSEQLCEIIKQKLADVVEELQNLLAQNIPNSMKPIISKTNRLIRSITGRTIEKNRNETFRSVQVLPKNEYITKIRDIMKERDPNLQISDEKIINNPACNLSDKYGALYVLVCDDYFRKLEGFKEKYLEYIAEHERWENWVTRKKGYNLGRIQHETLKRKLGISEKKPFKPNPYTGTRKEQVEKIYAGYNYEWRHEYAIYKEYLLAQKNGDLEVYHAWCMSINAKDLDETHNIIFRRACENDSVIRGAIFQKIKNQGFYHFNKEIPL